MKLKRKLHLAKETVRGLDGSELLAVGGGRTALGTCNNSCDPATIYGSICQSCGTCTSEFC